MTRKSSKSKQLRIGTVLLATLVAGAGCTAPRQQVGEPNISPRPGVAPEYWVCEPDDGSEGWQCRQQRGRLP